MLLRRDATYIDEATKHAARIFPTGNAWLNFQSRLPAPEVFRDTVLDDVASDGTNWHTNSWDIRDPATWMTDVETPVDAIGAPRYFVELSKLGAKITHVDVGGGLGIDYEGTRSRSYNSVNYGIHHYASSIVQPLAEACAREELTPPRIVTECGRAMTAHHAVLVTNVSEVERAPEGRVPDVHEDESHPVRQLRELHDEMGQRPAVEVFHEAASAHAEGLSLYALGQIDLTQRARIDDLFYAIAHAVKARLTYDEKSHRDLLDELNESRVHTGSIKARLVAWARRRQLSGTVLFYPDTPFEGRARFELPAWPEELPPPEQGKLLAKLTIAGELRSLVLELRVARARMTKDVDLRMTGSPVDMLMRLQAAGRRGLGDFMTFEVGPDDDHPEIQNDGMQYDGLRFRAECKLAGKLYGQPFGVDVAFGDPILGEPEVVVAEDVLAFAGIAPPTLRLYPIETHIAEKLHAYTMPRARPNSRVKDLPDLALLASA